MICDVAICNRNAIEGSEYKMCERHEHALSRLNETYSVWVKAFGKGFTKKQYYLTLITKKEVKTGKWVREVINHILEEEVSQ